MAVTIAPSTEACEAIRDRINSGGAYALHFEADISEQFADEQAAMTGLMVDVVPGDEVRLNETLAIEDRTSHTIYIEVRKKLDSNDQEQVDEVKLTTAQIFQRVNGYDLSTNRVRVWQCDEVKGERPNKRLLSESLIFRTRIALTVLVESSA